MIIADGVWWRRAVDPNFDAEAVLPMFFDVTKYMLLDRGSGRNAEPGWARASSAGEDTMKASRIVAVGLVVGAVAWVASGHLVPHESAESRAAIRADAGGPKRFASP